MSLFGVFSVYILLPRVAVSRINYEEARKWGNGNENLSQFTSVNDTIYPQKLLVTQKPIVCYNNPRQSRLNDSVYRTTSPMEYPTAIRGSIPTFGQKVFQAPSPQYLCSLPIANSNPKTQDNSFLERPSKLIQNLPHQWSWRRRRSCLCPICCCFVLIS